MVKIGDRVSYDGYEVEVIDVAYLEDVTNMIEVKFTTASNGTLCYKIKNSAGEEDWVVAEECELMKSDINDFYEQDTRSPHLLDLGYKMVGWLDGLPDRPDNSKLPEIVTLLMAIQYDKEGQYGSSWKGKGEYRGIMSNIDRKYDRLDVMTQKEIEGKLKPLYKQEELLEDDYCTYSQQTGESKVDAIADLANYCLLYMTYVKENYPNVFKLWVENNVPTYLRDKIPFV